MIDATSTTGNGTAGACKTASGAMPCPICERPDWCSFIPLRWAYCRRLNSHPAYGEGERCVDKSSAEYWRFRIAPKPQQRPEWAPPKFAPSPIIADLDVRDRVYRAILAKLRLSGKHLLDLERRGIPRDKPYPTGIALYRTLGADRAEVLQALIRDGVEELFPGIPGLRISELNGKRFWSIAGKGGLLVPVYSVDGKIQAIQVRLDEPGDGGKYRYLSSKKFGGSGPGSPVHFPHFPDVSREVVRITEGVLKANLATHLSGVYTIGLPTVGMWRLAPAAIKTIGANRVIMSFDSDSATNPAVAAALCNLWHRLKKEGVSVAS